MALPSSGAISIDDIRTELGTTTGSLAQLSAAVGFPAPHAMSDFYGYTAATPNDLYWDFSQGGDGARFVQIPPVSSQDLPGTKIHKNTCRCQCAHIAAVNDGTLSTRP